MICVGSDGRELFGEFLRGEFSEENLEFWLACEQYRVSEDDQLASLSQQIYLDFVAPNAPRQVRLFVVSTRYSVDWKILMWEKKAASFCCCVIGDLSRLDFRGGEFPPPSQKFTFSP